MPFMTEIEAAQRSPLDQLAVDFLAHRLEGIDFCRRVAGVAVTDETIARRLDVPVARVREWREIGRRARGWSCW